MTSSTPQTEAGPSTSSRSPPSTRPLSTSTDFINPRLRTARTLPPWVVANDERRGPITEEQQRLLNPPQRSTAPQRNSIPQPPQRRVSKDGFVSWDDPKLGPPQNERGRIPHLFKYGRASARGRKWDHLRSAEPVIISSHPSMFQQPSVSWADFIRSSAWGRPRNEQSEIIDIEALNQLQPNFNKETELPLHAADKHDRRRKSAFSKRVWGQMLNSSLSPLLFRLVVIIMSTVALAIAIRMFQQETKVFGDGSERTQSIFAIVVDCVSIPFNGYMIWDEYTGKPLGLRSATSKMSLILLDLFFIIFKSACTALAFEHVVYHQFGDQDILGLSEGLASVMLLGLVAWTANLTVNIFRVVERLGGREEETR
ncbi:hypothetical protein M441DRAFT_323707 [Trichoderma asperellum CBS 433.97]|uniref:Uncharacterized protein n=1 Tax=Trichoderma asperellum (strain ATCC 204424 / CBS 433.97 / NBRC 101777) TaxID=1042311 RepID=A0A2T3ZLP8_TRIA4|nr:hypothetical protein M441DRAFT_323707 [Trichoderma asperellum CBS 433.97]PTB45713.1 hypothetical protein M441DRAFT_323707 [Trichoderma asperellum CBS 433.97]